MGTRKHPFRRRVLLFTVSLFATFSENTAYPQCFALLINGGSSTLKNHSRYEVKLEEMAAVLQAKGCKEENIFVASASGEETSEDFYDEIPTLLGKPHAYSYPFLGKDKDRLFPGTRQGISESLKAMGKRLKAEDQVFIYLSDHGDLDHKNEKSQSGAKLCEDPKLFGAAEFSQILSKNLPSRNRVKIWADCCYCGEFNKVTHPNACVGTLSDEFHPSGVAYENYDEIRKDPRHVRPRLANLFSSHLRDAVAIPSLKDTGVLAQQGLGALKSSFQMGSGCIFGPRDSAQQFIFRSLNLASEPICGEKLKLLEKKLGLELNYLSYSKGDLDDPVEGECRVQPLRGFTEIEDFNHLLKELLLKDTVQNLSRPNLQMKERILALSNQVRILNEEMKNDIYYRGILEVISKYDSMSEEMKLAKAALYQNKVQELRTRLIRKYIHPLDRLQNLVQNLLLEHLFLRTATSAQKEEYERIQQCLNEPLF